jgi:hypothetical protein
MAAFTLDLVGSAFDVVFVLFCYMPVELGGLGLPVSLFFRFFFTFTSADANEQGPRHRVRPGHGWIHGYGLSAGYPPYDSPKV